MIAFPKNGIAWLFLVSSPAAAQIQSAFPSPGQAQPPQASETPFADQQVTMTQFQLTMLYSFPKYALDINGTRNLVRAPNTEAYIDEQPITGTFKGGSGSALRTTAAVLWGQRDIQYSLGLGLETLELGRQQRLNKSGGPSSLSFTMNSVALEFGVQRNINRWGHTGLRLTLLQGVSGKLQTRYLVLPTYTDATGTYTQVDDNLLTATRLGITGSYFVNLLPALAFGVSGEACFGYMGFEGRSTRSSLSGYAASLAMMLRL